MAGDLHFSNLLHFSIDGAAARAVREHGSAWIENASIDTQSTLCVDVCTYERVCNRRIFIDIRAGMCYTEEEEAQDVVNAINEKLLSGDGRRRVVEMLVSLQKEARARAHTLFPACVSERPLVHSRITHALWELAAHPFLAFGGAEEPERIARVLRGMCMAVTLMSNALVNIRWPLVCTPVPHWLLPAQARTGRHAAPTTGTEHVPLEFDAARLQACISSFPTLARAISAARDAQTFTHALLAILSYDTVCFIMWLLALSPIRLLDTTPAAPDSVATSSRYEYAVVHGSWTTSFFSPNVSKRGNIADQLREPPAQCLPFKSPTKRYTDEKGACSMWYHGTASDNAYAVLQGGMRSMSGTRHEKNGSIFGAGVYCTNDASVALQFATCRGTAWRAENATLQPMEMRCVLEMDIAAVPANRIVLAGKPVLVDSELPLVPPACYLVVPDAHNVRLTRLFVFGPPSAVATSAAGSTTPSDPVRLPPASPGKVRWAWLMLGLVGVVALLSALWFSLLAHKTALHARQPRMAQSEL